MPSVSDIIQIHTQPQNAVAVLQLLADRNILASGWEPTRVPRGLVEVTADMITRYEEGRNLAVRGRYLQEATGVYLDLLGIGWYDEERIPAETAELQVTISDLESRGPLTISNRQIAFALGAPAQLDYTQTGGAVTVPKGGSAVAFFRAARSGAIYNRVPGDIFVFTTTIPYASITSPPIDASGSIMTVAGRDIESDNSYRARCRGKWGTLGRGWGEDAITFLIREVRPEITKIGINDGLGGGNVNIYVATDAGPASNAATIALYNYFSDTSIKPVGVPPIKFFAAPVFSQQLVATLFNATNPNAASEASSRIVAFQNARGLGEPLYVSRLYEELIDVASGTVGANIVSPTADIFPIAFSLLQFSTSLTVAPPPLTGS